MGEDHFEEILDLLLRTQRPFAKCCTGSSPAETSARKSRRHGGETYLPVAVGPQLRSPVQDVACFSADRQAFRSRRAALRRIRSASWTVFSSSGRGSPEGGELLDEAPPLLRYPDEHDPPILRHCKTIHYPLSTSRSIRTVALENYLPILRAYSRIRLPSSPETRSRALNRGVDVSSLAMAPPATPPGAG